ncbi:MAG: hypothetical protein WCS03_16290, partial [Bacteroidota bacterium]
DYQKFQRTFLYLNETVVMYNEYSGRYCTKQKEPDNIEQAIVNDYQIGLSFDFTRRSREPLNELKPVPMPGSGYRVR